MTNRASFFRTRQSPTIHTVKMVTNPAKRAAKMHLPALIAGGLGHFLVCSSKELQKMTFEAFIISLQLLYMHLFGRYEFALLVMVAKFLHRLNSYFAGLWVIGAKEL